MQTKPVPGNVRVPTSAWSGYGLSHSSPAPELGHRKKESFATSLLDVMNEITLSLRVVLSSLPNFKLSFKKVTSRVVCHYSRNYKETIYLRSL